MSRGDFMASAERLARLRRDPRCRRCSDALFGGVCLLVFLAVWGAVKVLGR